MTRLEILQKEREEILNMRCLAFSIMDEAVDWYDREIEAIEEWGGNNPEYEE